jgi:hypothetical protein
MRADSVRRTRLEPADRKSDQTIQFLTADVTKPVDRKPLRTVLKAAHNKLSTNYCSSQGLMMVEGASD